MSVPLELVKETKDYVRLKCFCGREKWLFKSSKYYCSECYVTWNGAYLVYVKVSIKPFSTSDYYTVQTSKEVRPYHAIERLYAYASGMIVLADGIKVEAISREDFYNITQDSVKTKLNFVVKMLEITYGLTERKDDGQKPQLYVPN